MQIKALPLGPFETNAYLVWNAAGQAFVIDPGSDSRTLIGSIDREGLTPMAVLLTHAHFDHIGALGDIVERYAVPVVLDPRDRVVYESPANAMEPFFPLHDDLPATQSQPPADIPELACEMLPTPGHTPGGVSYYFAEAQTLFAGDTLFRGGVGRTDLPGGDWQTLVDSIRNVLFELPDATRVYPGHGPSTTIGAEKAQNPYVRGGA